MEFVYHPDDPTECLVKWRVKNFINLNDPIRSKDSETKVETRFQNLDWCVFTNETTEFISNTFQAYLFVSSWIRCSKK